MMMTNEEFEHLIEQLKKLKLIFKDFEEDPKIKNSTNNLIEFLEMLPTMD